MPAQFNIDKFRNMWWPDLSALGFAYHQALAAESLISTYCTKELSDNQENQMMICMSLLLAVRDQGHVCMPLSELNSLWQIHQSLALENNLRLGRFSGHQISTSKTMAELLLFSGLATLESAPHTDSGIQETPLVLRQENKDYWLYLRADQISENQLSLDLIKARNQNFNTSEYQSREALSTWIDHLPANKRDPGQKAAVLAALNANIFILTGGPGTGKTTTVFHILRALFHGFQSENNAIPFIALCAPTGRAAARMSESLQKTRKDLQANLQSKVDSEFVGLLDRSSGMTLHRLLDLTGNFRREPAQTILPFDIIIIDEASMIDLHMMSLLIRRLSPTTRLILVGDQNQLPSIESGAILAELMDITNQNASLPSANLTTVFRSSTQILECAQAVLEGDSQKILGLAGKNIPGLRLINMHSPSQRENQQNSIISEWIHREQLLHIAIQCAQLEASDLDNSLAELFYAASQSILLSPLHNGPFGTISLNEHINEVLRSELRIKGISSGHWFPGMMVMVVQNDYERGLFNGDRGLVYRLNGALRVFFPASSNRVALHPSPATIPGLEQAYALTIHKSQGSEYERVHLFLADSNSREGHISRELLYTGITRAKTGLTLVVDTLALESACATKVKRWSRLSSRLNGNPSKPIIKKVKQDLQIWMDFV